MIEIKRRYGVKSNDEMNICVGGLAHIKNTLNLINALETEQKIYKNQKLKTHVAKNLTNMKMNEV